MAARRGVLLTENDEKASNVVSECINPLIKNKKWRYANTDYYVRWDLTAILYVHTFYMIPIPALLDQNSSFCITGSTEI